MQKLVAKAAMASLNKRGSNGHTLSKVVYANSLLNKVQSYTQTKLNAYALAPQLKRLQQTTGKPIYIVGVISSYINPHTGQKVCLPISKHIYNRTWFAMVQKVLYTHCIYSINPANKATFARAIKAPKQAQRQPNCAAMFNTTAKAHGMQRAINNLQRANKRSVRACCAIVMVQPNISKHSGGVQQELAHALKYNPNAPIYIV